MAAAKTQIQYEKKEQFWAGLRKLTRNPVLPWALVFIFCALIFPQRGGDNTYARLATMRSITEEFTIRMDDYKSWSDDWSLSPNGHYYSDKAPGSALLGLPFFALTDIPFLYSTEVDAKGLHPAPSTFTYLFLLFFVQLLPFSILVLILAEDLSKSVPPLGVHFFAVAAFFGNTAAIYMSRYSGHPLAAWLFLAGFYSWRRERNYWAGLFVAAACLTDYASIMTLPFFLIGTILRYKNLRAIVRAVIQVCIGTLPIAVMWILYHRAAFGSAFQLAAGYANPENQRYDPNNIHTGPRSLVALAPYPEFFLKLIFGTERGILFTQAWVLALVASIPFLSKWKESVSRLYIADWVVVIGSLAGVLWLNSSVMVWSAGRAAGPRYICLVFPTIAYLVALNWFYLPRVFRWVLYAGLLEAVAYQIFMYPFNEKAPEANLWAYYTGRYADAFNAGRGSDVAMKFAVISICLLAALFFVSKKRGPA